MQCCAGTVVQQGARRPHALRRTLQQSSATCACGPATAFATYGWWTTTPSSSARCSAPSSRAWAHFLSSARRTTSFEEHQRQGGAGQRRHQRHAVRLRQRPQGQLGRPPTALASWCLQSTMRHRRWVATSSLCSWTAARTLGFSLLLLATAARRASRRRTKDSGYGRWRLLSGSC